MAQEPVQAPLNLFGENAAPKDEYSEKKKISKKLKKMIEEAEANI